MKPQNAKCRARAPRRQAPFMLACVSFCVAVSAACTQAPPREVTEKPDQPHAREAQSDFLDVGKRAGIEWLSFVPNDQREFPELFHGLDSDQKRRLRLAPREWPDRLLLEFNLPPGSKLWPVQWYGTELMAVDLPDAPGLSVAIARADTPSGPISRRIAEARVEMPFKNAFDDGSGGVRTIAEYQGAAVLMAPPNGGPRGGYAERILKGRTGSIRVVAEAPPGLGNKVHESLSTVVDAISIRRELALEGFPKHKCTSSIDELLQGRLIFPGGTLNLPLSQGHVARKVGGDSMIQIDGEGAQPWLILRRLKDSDAPRDIRTRVRTDTTFARHVQKPATRFSAGYRPTDAVLPVIAWDFNEAGAGQQVLGVIAVGEELLSFEMPATGVNDGESRRNAKARALALLAGATGDRPEANPLTVLEGWNIGTMGREK